MGVFAIITLLIFALWVLGRLFAPSFEDRKEDTKKKLASAPSISISKKDGTIERGRINDLEELCKDWFFYRRKIVEANRDGDGDALRKYQASFAKINNWLGEYRNEDVTAMMNKVGKGQ